MIARLLYVEEHAENVALVAKLLAGRKDLRLLRAADIKRAIALARSRRPEVILIDIDLAGTSALEFMKSVRAEPGLETTPVLALGANLPPEAVVRVLEAGFFQYLPKPLQRAPFLEALAFALEYAAVERSEQNPLAK